MGKTVVFLTSAEMAPVARSRVALTLNSSEKVSHFPPPRRVASRLRDCVRASTFTIPVGKSFVKKSFVERAKSPYLHTLTQLPHWVVVWLSGVVDIIYRWERMGEEPVREIAPALDSSLIGPVPSPSSRSDAGLHTIIIEEALSL